MFCGSTYVQNKDNKEIMITQTEFAVKITKVPMSPARKNMRDDLADKAEIHAFRGVSGSISWLAGQTRPDVSCQVSQLQHTLPQPTVAHCGSSMVVRRVHQHADLGLKIRRIPVQNMMLLLHVDASFEHWRCGWLTGWLYLWHYRQVIAGRMRCSVVSNGLEIIQNESDSTELLQELNHEQFDLQGAPAVMQERPPVCVTDCKSLYDHVSAVCGPWRPQDYNWQTASRKTRERLSNVFAKA